MPGKSRWEDDDDEIDLQAHSTQNIGATKPQLERTMHDDVVEQMEKKRELQVEWAQAHTATVPTPGPWDAPEVIAQYGSKRSSPGSAAASARGRSESGHGMNQSSVMPAWNSGASTMNVKSKAPPPQGGDRWLSSLLPSL